MRVMAKSKQPKQPRKLADRYGIGEWFGHPVQTLTDDQRHEFGRAAVYAEGTPIPKCPFLSEFAGTEVKCSKKGGVCSFCLYDSVTGIKGKLTTFCPNRFYEGSKVFRAIGNKVLGTDKVGMAKEVDFLTSSVTQEAAGSIDWVLFEKDNKKNWCALEFQAVYFSGKGMGSDFKAYQEATGVIFPTKTRRPDFRSSGPKRLMPQLMIKVPTLRRWGKKCAVVVDKEFFAAMGTVHGVDHISNSDIVWFVVSFDENSKLQIEEANVRFSTLEASVEGLTGGVPVPLPTFEERLLLKPQVTLAALAEPIPENPGVDEAAETSEEDVVTEPAPKTVHASQPAPAAKVGSVAIPKDRS